MKLTHYGILRGNDARTSQGFREHVPLRETKKFWISGTGNKYRKHGGRAMGEWPMYRLDIDSIHPLPTEESVK